ncbi:MAG: helix-turn-helix domain-containing protein [Selenomonadaceae bacterium]
MSEESREKYIETANPNAAGDFPYMVREVAGGKSLTIDPAFHVMHWHADLQFLLVTEGSARVETLSDAVNVSAGEAIFIGKNVVHCVLAESDAHYYNFLFPADLLRFYAGCPANDDLSAVLGGDALPLCRITSDTEWGSAALSHLERLRRFDEAKPNFYAYHVLMELFSLVLLLRENGAPSISAKPDDTNAIRTKQILKYIAAHYAEDVSLDAIAGDAHCSKSACLRSFQKVMKMTPYSYLIEYRIEQAATQLRQTSEPVGTIAERVGFRQMSLFGKYFKAHTGTTPKAYRARYR